MEEEWFFGWDAEHNSAFRVRPDGQEHTFTTQVLEEGAAEDEPIRVEFADGMVHSIAEITLAEWRMLMKPANKTRNIQAIHWQGKHSITKNSLVVKDRVDRVLLVSLYDKGSQVLQIRKDKLPGDAVVEIMKKAAVMYSEDKLNKNTLKIFKAEQLKEHTAVRKRPAAAPSAPSAQPPLAKRPAAAPSSQPPLAERPAVASGQRTEGEHRYNPFAAVPLPPVMSVNLQELPDLE